MLMGSHKKGKNDKTISAIIKFPKMKKAFQTALRMV
jgi:hypothetical protein